MKNGLIYLNLILTLLSCNPFKKHNSNIDEPVDPFYTDRGGFGTYLRVPLIKPYEAIKVSDNEWRIELQTTQLLELSIHNVRDINVIDSVIIVYAKGDVSIKDIKYNEAWFVIVPSWNTEKGFDKKEAFLSYLTTQRIKAPNFYDVDEVYQKFNKRKRIDW
jgi:hypothetical protein